MNCSANPSPAPIDRRRALALLAGLACAPFVRADAVGMATVSGLPPAPALRLPDVDDQVVDLARLSGRVVVVNFWATWCPPCRKEFPSLGRLQKLFKPEALTVLAVNVGEDAETALGFAGGADFPILLDRDGAVMGRWPVRGLPTTYVVDRAGRLALRAVGGREFDQPAVVAQLKELLG